MADAQLRGAARRKSGKEDLLHIGAPIPIGVFQIEDIGRAGDDQSAFPWHETVGKSKAIREYGSFLVASIAIRILQHGDQTHRRFAGAGPCWVSSALHHEQSARLIK